MALPAFTFVYSVRWWNKHGEAYWLEDTCAGGAWSRHVTDAKEWPSKEAAALELGACELGGTFEIVELVRIPDVRIPDVRIPD